MVTASTIYMSMMGPAGLREIAMQSHLRTREMRQELMTISGVEPVFNGAFFHEIVMRINQPVETVLETLAQRGIQAGYPLKEAYPELGECLLLCATETKSLDDIKLLTQALGDVLKSGELRGGKLACQA